MRSFNEIHASRAAAVALADAGATTIAVSAAEAPWHSEVAPQYLGFPLIHEQPGSALHEFLLAMSLHPVEQFTGPPAGGVGALVGADATKGVGDGAGQLMGQLSCVSSPVH